VKLSPGFVCAGFVILLAAMQALPAWSADQTEGDPYIMAARDAGVPSDLLIAIAGAESGYHPWALNIKGHQVFCQSRTEAESVLATTPTDDVDIGLMQINWRFWGPRSGVSSKEALLDPRRNLELGAAILKDSLSRGGSLWHRISNYHSGPPAERERYNRMVYDAYLHYMHGKIGKHMIR
jgi:soluble lytic murein transglycosylase-like protein